MAANSDRNSETRHLVESPCQVGQNTEGNTELIEAAELASRWRVPISWVRNRTRERTPSQERIPCVRLGRYVRFEWGSHRLEEWLAKQRD